MLWIKWILHRISYLCMHVVDIGSIARVHLTFEIPRLFVQRQKLMGSFFTHDIFDNISRTITIFSYASCGTTFS